MTRSSATLRTEQRLSKPRLRNRFMCALRNMLTPFDQNQDVAGAGEWAARQEKPKRSVFGNYSAGPSALVDATPDSEDIPAQNVPTSRDKTLLRNAINVAV